MKILLILLFTIILLPFASAHFPYIVDSKSSASDPVIINDIHRSQVWYFDQKTSPDIWLSFTINSPDQLFVQLGVPDLDKFDNYNPVLEIYHKHNSQSDDLHEHIKFTTDFDKPTKSCGRSSVRTDPCVFHEQFTDTYSWILAEDRLPLEPGTYYIKGSSVSEKGTLWIAVGEIEDFSLGQIPNVGLASSTIKEYHGNESSNSQQMYIAALAVLAFVGLVVYRRRNA